MSRSGYSDDLEPWTLIRWRGAVTRALKGRRGQAFLHELIEALEALPQQRLTEGALEADGLYCAIGAVGRLRGLDMTNINPQSPGQIADAFGIAEAMACEIAYMNDEAAIADPTNLPPKKVQRWREGYRWLRMRRWAEMQLKEDQP
jgi:hypothetical protein